MPNLERVQALRAEYERLTHAMQSGVGWLAGFEPESLEKSLKHLRVGINSAMVNQAATMDLLFRKGIVTEEEYYQALVDWMKKEVETYREEIKLHLGPGANVELH
jgi:hypothetical protein